MTEQEEVKQIVVDTIQGEDVEGLAGSEAALSSNFKYIVPIKLGDGSVQNFDIQTTVRGIPIPAHIAAHIDAVVDACIVAMGHGGITRFGDNVSVSSQAAPAPSAPAPFGDSAPAQAPTAQAPQAHQETAGLNEGEDSWFDCVELLVENKNNKNFYKVTGGMWKKFGVTIWEEVLATTGIKIDQLEGGKKYGMAGWRAFVKNNPETQKPQKVVRLEKKG